MEGKNYIGLIIKQINDALGKAANKELKENDITLSQIHMLWALKNSKGWTLTLKELEKTLGIAQPTALGTSKRLEQKNLVKSGFDSADKRVKNIMLLKKGDKICIKTKAHMDETEENLLKGLTKGERVLLTELLTRLYKNVES